MGNWAETPIQALSHALEYGVPFPLPDKPLNIDEMDTLAARLTSEKERFFAQALRLSRCTGLTDWQQLLWVRGLLLAAVSTYPWGSEGQDKEQGMALAKEFARLERKFLPRCYAPEVLQADVLCALPPLHRFGFYCVQAFDALDAGDTAGYLHLLREGLSVCEGMRNMVEFLVNHTPELNIPLPPSEELKALADQIRTILAKFSPNDPAVVTLKQSEAYRKVAYLIEGIEPPVVGGLP